jgi:hypothetical protein
MICVQMCTCTYKVGAKKVQLCTFRYIIVWIFTRDCLHPWVEKRRVLFRILAQYLPRFQDFFARVMHVVYQSQSLMVPQGKTLINRMWVIAEYSGKSSQ